jgi:hypothetical protein
MGVPYVDVCMRIKVLFLLSDKYKLKLKQTHLTLSLLERPKAANRKCYMFPRAAESGQQKDIFFLFTLPSPETFLCFQSFTKFGILWCELQGLNIY